MIYPTLKYKFEDLNDLKKFIVIYLTRNISSRVGFAIIYKSLSFERLIVSINIVEMLAKLTQNSCISITL